MYNRNIFGFLLQSEKLLPNCTCLPCSTPDQRPASEGSPADLVPTKPEKVVYRGMTPSQLDAIPCVDYNAFDNAMNSSWNFAWDAVVTSGTVAEKVDFAGTAPNAMLWHLGTDGEEGACTAGNAGWGVELRTIGNGNVAYMYNKLRVPAGISQFRVWAVGNTDSTSSGEGALRTVAVYRNENGEYMRKTLSTLGSLCSTKFYEEDGTVRFSKANRNMPGVQDGMISYDITDLPKGQDVIIFIESVGIGNVLGDENTEAAEGTPASEVMSDLVVIKRIMVMASYLVPPDVYVPEGMDTSVPTSDGAQEQLFKVAGRTNLYLSFLPPSTPKYAKAPALLLICGGGWITQSRAAILNMMSPMVASLRAEGFAVIVADYRLIDSKGMTAEEQVGDLIDALSYVSHYADVLGIDSQRIATSGHSAGGHLALMLTHAPKEVFPTTGFCKNYNIFCSVPFAAVTTIPGTNWSYVATKNGVYDQALAEKLSPITHVRADNVPTLIIHGNRDDVVPFELNAQAVMNKVADVGARYELLVSEYGNHDFAGMGGHKASPDLTEANHLAANWILEQLEMLKAQ